MNKKALIVVDMLNDFVDENGALYCGQAARDIVPFIQDRIEAYRRRGDLVIYLQDAHDEDDKEFEKFPKHSLKGTWGNAIIAELTPKDEDVVIEKRRYSGFFETALNDVLKKHDIQEAEVVGVCTNICVMDTVGGLANRDYPVTVPKAGVADFDADFHAFALKRMDQIYGAKIV
jgi:nicotinamidase-related amidase